MATRIIHFGFDPGNGILAALTGNGYEVDTCGASIRKLMEVLRWRDDVDAIAVTEVGASNSVEVLTTVHSLRKVPLILFQDGSGTCDPSQFDVVIPEHPALPDLLKKVAALIERSHVLRAESRISREQQRSLIREATSLREESAMVRIESQHTWAKLKCSVTEPVTMRCVLVVDDHAQWRRTMCAMLKCHADCQSLCEAGDGIEAVQRAAELKPQLILLDLNMPLLNGIEAARQIMQLSPDSVILFVTMESSADVVSAALSTGAKGYVLKADSGKDLWPAIEAVLQNKQYLSRGLRGLHSVKVN